MHTQRIPKIMFDPAKLVLVDPKTLKKDPKNRNKHSDAQIDRFCELLLEYGMRWPILVSERTGIIKAGEGRLLAALKLKMPQVLVSYQEFSSDEIEYGFGISDNAIASWAELDLSGIHSDIIDLGPELKIDLLGIKNFSLVPEVLEGQLPDLPTGDKLPFRQMTFTLANEQADEVERALALAKSMGDFVDSGNENSNGNALARVAEMFLGAN